MTVGEEGLSEQAEATKMVVDLCKNVMDARRWLCHEIGEPPPSEPPDYQAPSLFIELAVAAYKSRNSHYQQAIIVSMMLFDPSGFGRYMLRGETEVLQNQFMIVLKELMHNFIIGVRVDTGSIFAKTDDIMLRKTGIWITHVQAQFIVM